MNVGEQYRYIRPIPQGWLKAGMIGTVREILGPYAPGVGHFDEDDIVVMDFPFSETIATRKGSSVTGSESVQVMRAVSFSLNAFTRDLLKYE